MKSITKLLWSLIVIVGLGAAWTSQAQIESDATIRANVPHPFMVNNTTLPAGEYEVTVPDPTEVNVLEIRSADDKVAVLFETQPAKVTRVSKQSELVFDRVGDTYFLAQVFLSGDEGGNQVLKSKKQQRFEERGMVAEKHSISATPMQGKSSKRGARQPD